MRKGVFVLRKVTFLEHSGFFLELETCCLLFDYYRGNIPNINKPYYVFVSHAHQDHYNPIIFDLLQRTAPTMIIISDDIIAPASAQVHKMKANQECVFDKVKVRTLPSTDVGVAYLVQVEGACIYHAGDLHWWHWEEENNKQENSEAKVAYLTQIAQLKEEDIDIAFVVLDPRLDKQSTWGLDAFIKRHANTIVFPMHIWGAFDEIDRYKKQMDDEVAAKIITIHHPQEEFII